MFMNFMPIIVNPKTKKLEEAILRLEKQK